MPRFFREIYLSIKTILLGMRVTVRYCFARTITAQYPDVEPTCQERFKGFHVYEIERCIACMACARACPVDCISVERTAPRKLDKATGLVTGGKIKRFAINYTTCLFCGLCIDPCPTKCIHMGPVYDYSGYDRALLTVQFTELAKQGRRTVVPLWHKKAKLPHWAAANRDYWEKFDADKRDLMLESVGPDDSAGDNEK